MHKISLFITLQQVHNKISSLIIQWGSAGLITTQAGKNTVNFATSFNYAVSNVVSCSSTSIIVSRSEMTTNSFVFGWKTINDSTVTGSSTSYIAIGYQYNQTVTNVDVSGILFGC